jgi:hypothetical protein
LFTLTTSGRPPRSFPTIQTLCKCLFFLSYFKVASRSRQRSSSVAAWLSETVLRGRGPGASGFESHRRGRIFSKEGTSAGPWMCVYVYQGLTVGWWKEERHPSDTTARSAGFESQAGWASHGCCVVCVSCRPEKERRGEGGRGWPGKVPRSPAAPPREKREKLVDRKVPDRPIW